LENLAFHVHHHRLEHNKKSFERRERGGDTQKKVDKANTPESGDFSFKASGKDHDRQGRVAPTRQVRKPCVRAPGRMVPIVEMMKRPIYPSAGGCHE